MRGAGQKQGTLGSDVGTSGKHEGTSGGPAGTGGMAPLTARRWAFAVLALLAAVQGYANGVSRLDDLRGAGSSVAGWQIAIDEATSLAAWYLLMVAIWHFSAWARPPRLAALATLAAHAAMCVLVSLAHVALFVAFRYGAYALAGTPYHFTDDLAGSLLYEFRKDAVSYFIIVLAMEAVRHFTRPPVAAKQAPAALSVIDGAVTHRVPLADIAWAEAAGNYVTLHLRGRTLLHRTTLGALEGELGPEFARIHRSRLVRRDAVRRLTGGQSGDFTVMLDDGTELRGSRRFRDGLRSALP